ncbi:hypothetical protein JOE48_005004 [Methylobacterium sp. PvR107]|nr:hypothetical protein [Methylobacterium sp. PvR107]
MMSSTRMRLHVFTWLRRRASKTQPKRFAHVLEAAAALRVHGILVTPCGDDFQHWQMGDFTMTEADVIRFAVSRGLIADG